MRHTDQNRKPTPRRSAGAQLGPPSPSRAALIASFLVGVAACAGGGQSLAPAPSGSAAPDPSSLTSEGYDAPDLGAPDLGSSFVPYRSIAYTDLPPATRQQASREAEPAARATASSSPYFTEEVVADDQPSVVPPAPRDAYAMSGGDALPDLDQIVVTDDRAPITAAASEPARYASTEAATQTFGGETRSVMDDARRPADPVRRPAPAPVPAPAYEPDPTYEPVTVAEASPPSRGGYALHLASYRGADQATSGWDVLTRAHPVLSRLTPRRTRIDLPDQGAFVRLIAGPFGTDADARDACGALERAGAYCAVVPFGGTPL